MDLLGLTEDGRLVLWSATEKVQPITAFPMSEHGDWIKGGHYLIQWKSHAIVVHCAPLTDGCVIVQFMCSRAPRLPMARAEVERMLLGYVVPDLAMQSLILEALQEATEAYRARRDCPTNQRGRI